MAWCPKCKNEYRDGVLFCNDCKCELVSDLEEVKKLNATFALFQTDLIQRDYVEKLVKYLIYSGVFAHYTEQAEVLTVFVAPEKKKAALKLLQAFLQVEALKMMENKTITEKKEPSEDIEISSIEDFNLISETKPENYAKELLQEKATDDNESKKRRVSAAAQYDDYRSSAYTFFIVGGGLLIFTFLNIMKVVTFFDNAFTLSVMFLMSGAFLLFGYISFVKQKKLKLLAEQEKELQEKMAEWLKIHVTKETIDSFGSKESSLLSDNGQEGNESSLSNDDLVYMLRLENIRKALLKEFPDANPNLLEEQIETYYMNTLE